MKIGLLTIGLVALELTDDFKRGLLTGLALANVIEEKKRQSAFIVLWDRWKVSSDVTFKAECDAIWKSLGAYEKRGS